MQIKETTNKGLKRAYQVIIPASDIEARVSGEVKKIAPQVRMPGFRPGKVPANLVRKMHGEQLHAQAVNETIRESVDRLMKEKKLRPAMQPSISLGEGYEEGKDAELSVELEILPDIDAPKLEGLEIERLVVPVTEAQVMDAVDRIAANNKSYKDAPKSKKAAEGDQLIIDFVGRVDGTEFEGGKAEGAPLVIGSGQFIPGFEEQLTGAKAGDTKTITVTFPEDYPAGHLAGKAAEFDVTIQSVKVEGEAKADDEFAKNLGLESLDKLKELLRGQLEQETSGLTRTQMKRSLLDQLAAGHDFDVPEGMVEAEFDQIWAQLQQEAARADDPDAAMKEIEAEKDDYRKIAVRRVRLGLLLSEIGQANGVQVTPNEMSMLIQQAAQQYRAEDRERFIQYIQQEPMAAAQLRAPLYEDKVVDFLFSKAEITDRKATRSELEADLEAEEGHVHGPGCGHDVPESKASKGKAKVTKATKEKPEAKAASKPAKAAPKPEKPAKGSVEEGKADKPKPAKPLKEGPSAKAATEKPAKASKATASKAAAAKPAAKSTGKKK